MMQLHEKTKPYLLEAVPAAEAHLLYAAEAEEADCGFIGRVRGDYGSRGNRLWTTWVDHCPERKTQKFQDELDAVINRLREEDNVLSNLLALSRYCIKRLDAKLGAGHREDNYGFKIVTESFCYYLRALPASQDYHFYFLCYERSGLERYLTAFHPPSNSSLRFAVGRRYWSQDHYEMMVVNRFDRTGLISVEIGFGLPTNYKVRKDGKGREYIVAKGKTYEAS